MSDKKITPKTFEKSKFYTASDVGLGYLCAIIAPYVIALLILIVCRIIMSQGVSSATIEASKVYKVFSMLVAPVGFCIVFFAFNKVRNKSIVAANVKFKIGIWNVVICCVVALVCVFGCQYFIGGIDHILQSWGYKISSMPIPLENFGWYVLALIIVALLPAIFEELIFRGIILNGLRKCLGDISAIFLSAALFALMHGSLEQLIYPFMLGIILGWVARRMNSTFASMIVHFLNNAIVITIQYISVATGKSMALSYNAWQWVLAVALLIVAAVIIYLIEKFYFKHKNKNEEEVKEEEKLQEKQKVPVMVWVGMGISAAIVVINTAIAFMPSAA